MVLKVAWRHDEALHEADGLRVWAGDAAVCLYDSALVGDSSVLLVECCEPGIALGEAVAEPGQDEVIAGLLRRLWRAPVDGGAFRPLQAMCDAWAEEFVQRLAVAPGAVDPGLARAGTDLFRALPASADRRVLLCTDLHAGNVLSAGREPWLVVDPKPYVGDPTYDVIQHLLNCDRLHEDPIGLAHRMADRLDLDPDRLLRWLFARCVLESVDQPDLGRVAERLTLG
jgi:streptomycin 6-kinase